MKRMILSLFEFAGYKLSRIPKKLPSQADRRAVNAKYRKVHYGAGNRLLDGWINVDLYREESIDAEPIKVSTNLAGPHPFPDNSFDFGFCEDFFEHLEQKEQLTFLVEAYRTLSPGAVLRLSFPGLEGVLAKHYHPSNVDVFLQGAWDAYGAFDHKHFPSRPELEAMCRHIGFKEVDFTVEFGKSKYSELAGLDSRADQVGLNTYVEIKK